MKVAGEWGVPHADEVKSFRREFSHWTVTGRTLGEIRISFKADAEGAKKRFSFFKRSGKRTGAGKIFKSMHISLYAILSFLNSLTAL